eukprot:756732-Hanusia_phi.AAC.13
MENTLDLTVDIQGMQSVIDRRLTDYKVSDPTCEIQLLDHVYTTKSLRHLLPDGTLPTWNEKFTIDGIRNANGSLVVRFLNRYDGKREPVLLGSLRFPLAVILHSRCIKGNFTLSEASQIHYAEDQHKEFISPFKEKSLKQIRKILSSQKNEPNMIAANDPSVLSSWPRIVRQNIQDNSNDDEDGMEFASNARDGYGDEHAMQAHLATAGNVITLCISAQGQFYRGEREFIELIRRLGFLSHLEDFKNAGIKRIDDLLRGFDDDDLIGLFPEMKKSKRSTTTGLPREQVSRSCNKRACADGNDTMPAALNSHSSRFVSTTGFLKRKTGPSLMANTMLGCDEKRWISDL